MLAEREARKLGWTAFPAPMAILSRPYRGRSACVHCGFCETFGCEMRAKSSTLATMIPEAEATGRCEARPHSYVRRVEVDGAGRATDVTYFDARKREAFQRARSVVLSANGAETPRLLLMSASSRFPDGLANSSGWVGTRLMFNGGAMAGGLFEHEVNGYKGADFKHMLRDYFTRSAYALAHTTQLPVATNAVSLDPTVKDAWGLPAIRVTFAEHANDLKLYHFMLDRAMELLGAAGATKCWPFPIEGGGAPVLPSVHLLGTCRMGNDPRRSVVDRYHRAHDVPNLFIVDGSSFVTSGRGQPTLTIQALAFRAAEHMSRMARQGELNSGARQRA